MYPIERPESSILAGSFRQWAEITSTDITILEQDLALHLTDSEGFKNGRTEIAKLGEN